jgi:putative DNA primase/helicase
MTTTPTIDAARGRWREILPALGVSADVLNGKHQPCPMCGGVDRFRFHDERGDGDFFCSQCGSGKGIKFLQALHGWDFRRTADEVDRVISNLPAMSAKVIKLRTSASPAELNRMWLGASQITDSTAVGRYLMRRGIDIEKAHLNALRSTRLLHTPTQMFMPVMIARFCDADGKPTQIHRTYLTEDGYKADVEQNRMFMPGGLPKGGAIRLGPVEALIGIAEGIETALSASMLCSAPVWATTTASMLELWSLPRAVSSVLILGDNDASYTGQAAAFALAKRLKHEAQRDKITRRIEVMLPTIVGEDWNDVLLRQAKEGKPHA